MDDHDPGGIRPGISAPVGWPFAPAADSTLTDERAAGSDGLLPPAPPAPPAPAPSRRRRLIVAGAVAVAVVLLAVAVLGGRERSTATETAAPAAPSSTDPSLDPTPSPPPTPVPAPVGPPPPATTTSIPSTTPPVQVPEAVIVRAIAFVERTRGLTFKQRPTISVLSEADFVALMLSHGPPAQVADQSGAQLQALGIVPTSGDLTDVATAARAKGTDGFYDSATGSLTLRGGPTGEAHEEVLVHELTHALDDQVFDLGASSIPRDVDAASAHQALVEGDAVWVQNRWRAQAGLRPIAFGGASDPTVPSAVTQMLDFPYVVGPLFVGALRSAGGQRLVDAAFELPPRSTEQVVHPDRYLTRDEPKPVDDPPAPADAVHDRGTFGEQRLLLTLAPVVGDADAVIAATGWGGGRFVAWAGPGVECVRATLVMDTQADTRDVVAALRRWATAAPGRSLSDDGLTLTTCRQVTGKGAAV